MCIKWLKYSKKVQYLSACHILAYNYSTDSYFSIILITSVTILLQISMKTHFSFRPQIFLAKFSFKKRHDLATFGGKIGGAIRHICCLEFSGKNPLKMEALHLAVDMF